MRPALAAARLEPALQAAIVAAIFTAVLATGAILEWVGPARKLRWAALVALAVLAAAYAVRRRGGRKPIRPLIGAAALVGLALLSAAWSTHPVLTVGRAGSLALLLAAGGALAYATAGRPEAIKSILDAVAIGAVLVALGGLVVLVVRPERALQAATVTEAARYQGLGGNPNTAAMVLALAVPLVLAAAFDRLRPAAHRLGAVAALLLLAGSIAASASRGAIAAAALGSLLVAAGAPRNLRLRAAGAAAVTGAVAIVLVASQLPDPDPAAAMAASTEIVGPPARPGFVNADYLRQLEDDVGHPGSAAAGVDEGRSLLGTSGRAQAWEGALRQGLERPLVGYGFGTEDRVFVDRFVRFGSDLPESSYLGTFLQLGAVGALLLFGLIGALLARGVRALAEPAAAGLLPLAGAGGAVAAGLALAVSQSYVTAAGSVAAGAFWLCVFMLASASEGRGSAQ